MLRRVEARTTERRIVTFRGWSGSPKAGPTLRRTRRLTKPSMLPRILMIAGKVNSGDDKASQSLAETMVSNLDA